MRLRDGKSYQKRNAHSHRERRSAPIISNQNYAVEEMPASNSFETSPSSESRYKNYLNKTDFQSIYSSQVSTEPRSSDVTFSQNSEMFGGEENETIFEELENTQTAAQVFEKNSTWQVQKEHKLTNLMKYDSSYSSMVTSTPCVNLSENLTDKSHKTFQINELFQTKKHGLEKEQHLHSMSNASYKSEMFSFKNGSNNVNDNDTLQSKKENYVTQNYNLHNNNSTTTRRKSTVNCSMLSSSSSDNSLEANLFHDISFAKTAKYFISKFYDNNVSENKFYKLDGTFLTSDIDFSDNEEENNLNLYKTTNHVKRSIYRQKRRDWYLQRYEYNYNERNKFSQLLYLVIFYVYIILRRIKKNVLFIKTHVIKTITKVTFLQSIITKTQFIISRLFLQTFLYIRKTIYTLFNTSIKRFYRFILFTSSYFRSHFSFYNIDSLNSKEKLVLEGERDVFDGEEKLNKSKEKDRPLGLCFGCCLWIAVIALLVPLIFMLVGMYSIKEEIEVDVPNPMLHGLHNTLSFIIETENHKIPLWHFYPNSANINNLPLINEGPAILYLRKHGEITRPKRLAVYESLASLGYHIIVPIDLVNDEQRNIVWTWMKKTMNKSALYIWGDHLETKQLTTYAKDFCDKLIPPSGVIIEVANKHPSLQHRSLEVWSCNCTTVSTDSDLYHQYNHVKCPFTMFADNVESHEDIYNQIVTCIQALHR